ncbi:MAG: transcriptional regulator [Geobacter sp.]|nr:MAG: transcriptional regulator [Geobacter sp.]
MFDLGIRIRQARKEKGLTQAQLADMAGITRKTLSQVETGAVSDIGIRKVERTLEVLGLELTVRPAGAPPTLEELQKENMSR